MTMTAQTTETTKRCDAKKVSVGAVFSRHSFGTVIAKNYDGSYQVRNANGFDWSIGANILEQEFSFAASTRRRSRCPARGPSRSSSRTATPR